MDWSKQYLQYGKVLTSPRTFDLFDGEKIIMREITSNFPNCMNATYSNEVFLFNMSNIGITKKEGKEIDLKYILAILNSKLISIFFIKNTAKSVRKLFPKLILNDLPKFPMKEISLLEQKPFIEKAEEMLKLNEELQTVQGKFLRTLERKFDLTEPSKTLQNWHTLDYKTFTKELAKKKIKLSLTDEAEWEDYFTTEQTKAQTVAKQIATTVNQINQMVYQLYGLTDDEIAIIEQAHV